MIILSMSFTFLTITIVHYNSLCKFFQQFLFSYFLVNVGEDCPVFDGLYEFCQLSTGGSVGRYFEILVTQISIINRSNNTKINNTGAT